MAMASMGFLFLIPGRKNKEKRSIALLRTSKKLGGAAIRLPLTARESGRVLSVGHRANLSTRDSM